MSLAEHLDRHRQRHLDDLIELLRLPSVSTDPARASDVRRTAEYLRDELASNGFESELIETGGHPAVFAERRVDDDLPTVLVYGHYDVQPVDPIEQWRHDPFEPTLENGALVARGACDDKGQVYAHVKAAQAMIASEGELPVNLKFLIEGEEEVGSPNLAATVRAHQERLACDTVVISDGTMLPGPTPTITCGVRGMAYVEVHVRSADRDLHSGAFGGAVPNPILALAELLAGLKDARGRITVPGFYDAVRDPSPSERDALRLVPFDEEAFRASVGLDASPGEQGWSVLERLWMRPTLDPNGIGGGFQGEGGKTVIPASAFAKVSCRLVPDQDPVAIGEALLAHLRERAPAGVHVEGRLINRAQPALIPLDTPAMRAAARAIQEVDGRDPVYVRTGGSIPIVAEFQKQLGAPVLMLDMGLEEDRIHSPNEKFDVALYHRGIHLGTELLRQLGRG